MKVKPFFICMVLLVMCVVSLSGCADIPDDEKFDFSCVIAENGTIGDTAVMKLSLRNKWKDLDVETGYYGPFGFEMYLDGEKVEIDVLSVARELSVKKGETVEQSVILNTERSGNYSVVANIQYRVDGELYRFCRKEIEFTKQ